MLERTSSPGQLEEVHARPTTRLTSSLHELEETSIVAKVADAGSGHRRTFPETGESNDAPGALCAKAEELVDGGRRFSFVGSADAEPQPSALALAPVPCLQPPACGNSVNVPPSAIPAGRFGSVYDGTFYLPPGTTKRALGRLRIVWCCVVTTESWHAFFVGVPILFFSTLFVTAVVPRGEWFTYLLTVLCTIMSVACLALSVTLDPGVIPPASQSEQPTQPMTVAVGGKSVVCKVCTTCHIIRPPRSTHCRVCDVCVEEFDHHCGILGSCVGKRTFRFFGGFFIFTSFLTLYILIRCFIIIASTDFTSASEQPNLIWVAASCILCIVAAIMGAILVMPFAGRYIMLSATNSTLKETSRTQQQTQSGEHLPGCVSVGEMNSGNYCVNFFRRLFSPIGRSRVPFDYYV
ncbi:hypothetical protein GH5_01037 [Leishmania sp. Ghana 2012 LV757]|uniref:hypothetical protein n=1 Tax=Leishmania sp. Ghana 2012 LV757 TaxID=2803181 RepID=UPI001B47E059|nr:hypothetical protein GH5_01037 [Leishmania sp. Ghana 2012 LV757]